MHAAKHWFVKLSDILHSIFSFSWPLSLLYLDIFRKIPGLLLLMWMLHRLVFGAFDCSFGRTHHHTTGHSMWAFLMERRWISGIHKTMGSFSNLYAIFSIKRSAMDSIQYHCKCCRTVSIFSNTQKLRNPVSSNVPLSITIICISSKEK